MPSKKNLNDNLRIEKSGHIARVIFDREEKANALNRAFLIEIKEACLSFAEDVDTRVVIFSGSGKHFSSGADLSSSPNQEASLLKKRRDARAGEEAILALLNMDQISIASWNGAAMGGGACIATACDFRVGTPSSFMQYPEIDIGVNLMWKSLPLLINLIGPSRSKRMVIGGDRITGEELHAWGVLDKLVSEQELSKEAQLLAEKYAKKAPIAAQMIKQSTNNIVNALSNEIMHMDFDQNLFTAQTRDRSTAIKSYLDKTEPDFEGD